MSDLGISFWSTRGRNRAYYRVLVALSGPLFAVTNRIAGSWWLFLALSAITNRTIGTRWLLLFHSWPSYIVLPDLDGSFWPHLRNKSNYWVLAILSGPLLAVINRIAGFWGLSLTLSWPKSYCRVLEALSGLLVAVTN